MCIEVADEPPLPWRLHRARVVALPEVAHRLRRRYPVEDRETGQGGSGAPTPAVAGDLDPLILGATQAFEQNLAEVRRVGRQPEVRPPDPAFNPAFSPILGGGRGAQQVHAEGRWPAGRHR